MTRFSPGKIHEYSQRSHCRKNRAVYTIIKYV